MAGLAAIKKADFETAIGRPLTDDQYDKLRMGVMLGFDGAAGMKIPRSTAAMDPAQQEAIGRVNWLRLGEPEQPMGYAAKERALEQSMAKPKAKPKAKREGGPQAEALRADAAPFSGPDDARAEEYVSPYAGSAAAANGGWQAQTTPAGASASPFGGAKVKLGTNEANMSGFEGGTVFAPSGSSNGSKPTVFAPYSGPVKIVKPGDPSKMSGFDDSPNAPPAANPNAYVPDTGFKPHSPAKDKKIDAALMAAPGQAAKDVAALPPIPASQMPAAPPPVIPASQMPGAPPAPPVSFGAAKANAAKQVAALDPAALAQLDADAANASPPNPWAANNDDAAVAEWGNQAPAPPTPTVPGPTVFAPLKPLPQWAPGSPWPAPKKKKVP